VGRLAVFAEVAERKKQMNRSYPDYNSWNAARKKELEETEQEMRRVDTEILALKKKRRQLENKRSQLPTQLAGSAPLFAQAGATGG
jgi:septal ring factor EnvC (AmiA/AmiB activator)